MGSNADLFRLPDPWLSGAVLACVVLFPLVHLAWRKRKNAPPGTDRSFEKIDAIRMAWAGASAPQAVCMLAWPVFPATLSALSEAPLLLIPTGISALTLLVGEIFDWK